MPQQRATGIQTPINSDAYNLTADLAKMADTTNVGVKCNGTAERDALVKFQGLRVRRTDRDNLIQEWNGTTWEWVSPPTRIYADPTTFSTAVSQVSKAVGSITLPVKTYDRKVRANARLSLTCSTISSGTLKLKVAVSVNLGQVTNAQGKSNVAFLPPGGYVQTIPAETDWVLHPSSSINPCYLWIEHVIGAVNQNASNIWNENHFWVEILPADD